MRPLSPDRLRCQSFSAWMPEPDVGAFVHSFQRFRPYPSRSEVAGGVGKNRAGFGRSSGLVYCATRSF